MNIDKTIKELTNRLDDCSSIFYFLYNNHENRKDGINYWKGKKIISIKDLE